MSIRKAVGWLFDVGDGPEGEGRRAAGALDQDNDPGDVSEGRLYGQAEAIRVLYQKGLTEAGAPKPPRPKRGRGAWIARHLASLTPALRAPTATSPAK